MRNAFKLREENSSMSKTALLVAAFALFISFAHATSAFLPDHAAIGYPYNYNASLGTAYKNTYCMLSAKDKFGTDTKSWIINEDQFQIQTDSRGFLTGYVVPTDAFKINENYSFTLSCADQQFSQNVSFEVGGSSIPNIFAINALEYFNARPDESVLYGIIGIIVVIIAIAAGRIITGKKTLW